MRVVRFDVDKEVNPWGLALDCDETMRPELLTEPQIGQPFMPEVTHATPAK